MIYSWKAEGRARLIFRVARSHTDSGWAWRNSGFPGERIRTGQSNTMAGWTFIPYRKSTGPQRSVPGYAFPFTQQM